MMALNLDMLDVLSKVLPASAPAVTQEAPDFALMMTTAGHGEPPAGPDIADPEATLRNGVSMPLHVERQNSSLLSQRVQATPRNNVTTPVVPGLASESADISNPSIAPRAEPPTARQPQPFEARAVTIQGIMLPKTGAPELDVSATGELPATDADSVQPSEPGLANPAFSQGIAQPILQGTTAVPAVGPDLVVEIAVPTEVAISVAVVRSRAPKALTSQAIEAPKLLETSTPPAITTTVPVLPEAARVFPEQRIFQTDPAGVPPADNRTFTAASQLPPERALPTVFEKMVAFTPTVIDTAHDLAQVGNARDMKFSVRPETLGPVAVSIERTEAGQHLRLGVETPAAVHAVRQAEPMLNDARGGSPFVNVTVDLFASDQRGRAPRAAPVIANRRDIIPHEQGTGPVLSGRYA